MVRASKEQSDMSIELEVTRASRGTMLGVSLALALATAACGDDAIPTADEAQSSVEGDGGGGNTTGDKPSDPDGSEPDAGKPGGGRTGDGSSGDGETLDGGPDASDFDGGTTGEDETDAGSDAGIVDEVFEAIVQGTRPLNAAQADRFWVTAFASNDKFYAAGFVTDAVSATVVDQKWSLARFNLAGELDTTFGDVNPKDASKKLGVVRLNLTLATTASDMTESARAIAVQPDGKVLVAGTYSAGTAGDPALPQVDVAVARFNSDGTLDSAVGGFSIGDADAIDGVLKLDIAPAGINGTQTINDDVGGISVDSQKRIVLFARGKSTTAVDANRYVLRFDEHGAADTNFAGTGRYEFSTAGAFNENAKQGAILANDAIVSPGYTSIDGKNHIVVIKLDADGVLVDGFADEGALVINPFLRATPAETGFVECYGVAFQADGSFVTTGYGKDTPDPTPGAPNRMYSFRFSATGQLDPTWGVKDGYFVLDAIDLGVAPGSIQGRNLVSLPDDRVVMVGNATASAAEADGNGVVALLTKDGQLDTSFNEVGYATYDFGLKADALYGLAVSPDGKHVVAAGYAGAGGSTGQNVAYEESAIVLFSVP